MAGARELCHVCRWYQGYGFLRCMLGTRGSPTAKYGIIHMKPAGAIAVVFLVNHHFPSHDYLVNGVYGNR